MNDAGDRLILGYTQGALGTKKHQRAEWADWQDLEVKKFVRQDFLPVNVDSTEESQKEARGQAFEKLIIALGLGGLSDKRNSEGKPLHGLVKQRVETRVKKYKDEFKKLPKEQKSGWLVYPLVDVPGLKDHQQNVPDHSGMGDGEEEEAEGQGKGESGDEDEDVAEDNHGEDDDGSGAHHFEEQNLEGDDYTEAADQTEDEEAETEQEEPVKRKSRIPNVRNDSEAEVTKASRLVKT